MEGNDMQPRKEQGAGLKVASAKMTPLQAGRTPATASDAGEGLLDYHGAARYLCTTTRHVRELWARRQLVL